VLHTLFFKYINGVELMG